jgi:hypothetical protein
VDVVATGRGGHSVSLQTSERGGAAAPQGSDAELRKQLRESQNALKATHDDTIAASYVMNEMLDAEQQQMASGANLLNKRTSRTAPLYAAQDTMEAKQRREKLLLEAKDLVALTRGRTPPGPGVRLAACARAHASSAEASAVPKPPDATKSKDCDLAAFAARGQWEGGGDNAPAAQLTPAKATPSPPPASTVPPADDPAAKLASRLQWQQEREERVRKLAEGNAAAAEAKDHDAQASNAKAAAGLEYKNTIAACPLSMQWQQEREERVRKLAESNTAAADAKDAQASNAKAAAELEYKCKIALHTAHDLAEQKAKEAAEHAEQSAREAEAEQVLADAEQNATKQLAEQQAAAKEREQQQENAKPQTHSNAGASGLCKRRFVKVDFLRGDEPLAAPNTASEERERERERSPAFMRECGQSTGAQDHKQAESTATGSTP